MQAVDRYTSDGMMWGVCLAVSRQTSTGTSIYQMNFERRVRLDNDAVFRPRARTSSIDYKIPSRAPPSSPFPHTHHQLRLAASLQHSSIFRTALALFNQESLPSSALVFQHSLFSQSLPSPNNRSSTPSPSTSSLQAEATSAFSNSSRSPDLSSTNLLVTSPTILFRATASEPRLPATALFSHRPPPPVGSSSLKTPLSATNLLTSTTTLSRATAPEPTLYEALNRLPTLTLQLSRSSLHQRLLY